MTPLQVGSPMARALRNVMGGQPVTVLADGDDLVQAVCELVARLLGFGEPASLVLPVETEAEGHEMMERISLGLFSRGLLSGWNGNDLFIRSGEGGPRMWIGCRALETDPYRRHY